MNLKEYFFLVLTDYTLRTITIGTALLGAMCGMLGSFAVLRKQSLLGDAISHAALPGIAIAFLIYGSKNSFLFLIGALISGLIGTFWIRNINKNTHLKSDTSLGLILSLFFGFGILLLTYIQKQPNANQAGLENYLFGQAATLVEEDVLIIGIMAGISLLTVLFLWKEFKLILFDSQYTKTVGFNTKIIDIIISTFIVLAIVLGLQTVGVVLMSAMLLAPAAAARQWTNKLNVMVGLAALLGALSGVIGTAISASENNLSTGPVIVLVCSSFVLISFIFSPLRGLLFRQIRIVKNRNTLNMDKTLNAMYNIARSHKNFNHPHNVNILNDFQGFNKKSMRKLYDKKYIEYRGNQWNLTSKGYDKAYNLYRQISREDNE